MSTLSTILTPRLAEMGAVRIGMKDSRVRTSHSGNEWRAPVKLDHMVITTSERDARGDLVRERDLEAVLAADHASPDGKLREIPIVLMSDEIDEVLLAAYTWYEGKSLVGRCDGETLTWFCDKQRRKLPEPVSQPCDGQHNRTPFKLHAALNFVIAAGDARLGGVYRFRTTSRISAEQLYGSLLHIANLTGGVLQGLPMRLVMRPIQVNPDGRPTTVYVVHVELRGADFGAIQKQALQLAQMRRHNLKALKAARREYVALLRAPGEQESPVEQADVSEEFHPPEGLDEPEGVPDLEQAIEDAETVIDEPPPLTDEDKAAIEAEEAELAARAAKDEG